MKKRFRDERDFENEAKVLTFVRHCPFILHPTSVDVAKREIAFAEAMDGDLLGYRSEAGLCYFDLVKICRQLVLAIEAIHRVGYLHMDVKPENIVREGARVWLIDLGLATPKVLQKRNIGTRRTMSPEVLLSHLKEFPVTEASDWWSVGVTIFYMYARFFHLPETAHYGCFPYMVKYDNREHPIGLEWPPDAPYAFPPMLFDLLFGRRGLLSFNYHDRLYSGNILLLHPFFNGNLCGNTMGNCIVDNRIVGNRIVGDRIVTQ